MKYYSGNIEVKFAGALPNAQFLAIGGLMSKHNSYDSFKRTVGSPLDGAAAILPITRKIDYKKRPSLHKCDARCASATGHVCECSCGGKNHGANK